MNKGKMTHKEYLISICKNHKLTLTKHYTSNNSLRLNNQCLVCGYKESNAIKFNKSINIDNLPFTDMYKWELFNNKAINMQLEKTEIYHNYINSEKWKLKRNEVIKDYNGLCFYCFDKGTDVHHKHYDNFGNEPLSDLVLLCRKCHEQEHKDNPNLKFTKYYNI